MLRYIGFYTRLDSPEKRSVSAAAITKMNYVSSKLVEASGGDVFIFSIGRVLEGEKSFYKSQIYSLNKSVYVKEAASYKGRGFWGRAFGSFFTHIQLLYYLFFEIPKDDILVIYHSLYFEKEVRLFRLLKNNKVIMEVEELYMAAWGKSRLKDEIKYLSQFDAYIYVNDIMEKRFCFQKPYVICYGNYNLASNYYGSKDPKKLIYAGGLGLEGSDVDLAIKTAKLLPSDYHLYIAGTGNEQEIAYVKDSIEGYNNIEYCGFLYGDKYELLLNEIQFGLCTRILPNNLSDYTFPSKVLVYMSHGIIPVCPPLNCIKDSKVKDAVLFYEKNDPLLIADRIIESSYSYQNVSMILQNADTVLTERMRLLLDILAK